MSGNVLQFTSLTMISNLSSCHKLKIKQTLVETAEEKSFLLPLHTQKYMWKNMQQGCFSSNLPLARTPYITTTSLYKSQTTVKKAPSSHKKNQKWGCLQDCNWICHHPRPPQPATATKTYFLPLEIAIYYLYASYFFFCCFLFKFPLTLQLRPNSSYYSSKTST